VIQREPVGDQTAKIQRELACKQPFGVARVFVRGIHHNGNQVRLVSLSRARRCGKETLIRFFAAAFVFHTGMPFSALRVAPESFSFAAG
jgi:hypothetical protein